MGGISAIIGAIALLGFLVFLAGVGMIVVAASQGRQVRGGIVLAVAGLVAGLLLSVISQGVIVIQPQEVAVVFQTLEGNLETPRGEGTHIIVPVLQEATIYSIARQEYTMSGTTGEGRMSGNDTINARTRDGQTVQMDVTIFFQVNVDEVNELHRNWQERYREEFVRPTVRGLIRDQVALFNAEALYTEERVTLREQSEQVVREAFESEGITLVNLVIRDIGFSAEFLTEIEAKVSAEQRQQRVQTEAETARIEAQGLANAAIESARGNAEARLLEAAAEAEALRIISEQIAANPTLIQYQYIQQLSDNVALALIPSNSPFLFDFDSVTNLPESMENFTAPDVPNLNADTLLPDDEDSNN
jgi:regulator of protease activity HflC (stomatin/prohibitin superfamily)